MTIALSDLELFYLDDNGVTLPTANFTDYQSALVWQPWGVRTGGTPGNNTEFFSDSINEINSQPSFFLKGKYDVIGAATGNNETKDYIIDTTDALLGNSYPLYQYTWFAIANLNSTEYAFRFGMESGFLPNTDFGVPNSIQQSTQTVGIRMMGLLDNPTNSRTSALSVLNALKTGNFPHQASIQQRNSSYAVNGTFNWWDARGAGTASKLIFRGYNNQLSYAFPTISHNPWQICTALTHSDALNNLNRQQHIMDIPPSKILIGIITISKDGTSDFEGDGAISMETVQNYSWKYSELNCEFDAIAIS